MYVANELFIIKSEYGTSNTQLLMTNFVQSITFCSVYVWILSKHLHATPLQVIQDTYFIIIEANPN